MKYIPTKEQYGKAFSKYLKEMIEQSGLTQREVAEKAGITEVSLSRYLHEDRLPGIYTTYRVLEALGKEEKWEKEDEVEEKTTKIDYKTAEWLVEHFNDKDAFPVEFEECEKCGASYIQELGHSCDTVIEVPVHSFEEEE